MCSLRPLYTDRLYSFFFFNDPATPEFYTLSLHDALPIYPNDPSWNAAGDTVARNWVGTVGANVAAALFQSIGLAAYLLPFLDRKSTRLNSSHLGISYAVFCLKKKKKINKYESGIKRHIFS